MTTTRYLDTAGGLMGEAYSGGVLDGLRVTNQFDHLQRRTNIALINAQGTTLVSTRYTHDTASRLQSVRAGTNSAGYSYVANSPLVGQIYFTNGTALRMTTSKTFDFLNRLTGISSVSSAASVVSFEYSYNSANQRTLRREMDQSLWRFDYDPLGQVKRGARYWPDFSPVAGQQFEFAFDDIGNRTSAKAGGDDSGANLRTALYYPNNLNQYWSNTVPGIVDVMGVAYATSSVTVNALSSYRKGEYFRKELPVDNNDGPVWTNVAVAAIGQATVSGNAAVAPVLQEFAYDEDGNLTHDGLWIYYWDAENRLKEMVSSESLPEAARKGLAFTYDHQGRRIEKQVYSWDSQQGYVLDYTHRFVYDGWNLIAVLDENNAPVLSFTWGTDLSGTMQGAGGVGGLLSMTVHSGAQAGTYFYCFDGNGNVVALVSAADGTVAARYEYGPFGEVLRATGPMAKVNPIRFSTQYQDDETDLVCYLHRYYNPSTGRWLSRDPINEPGFDFLTGSRDSLKVKEEINLYGFVGNDPIEKVDRLGLELCLFNPLRAGTVDFAGFTAAALGDFRLIPETGTTMTTPSNGRSGSVDGFWWRHSKQWFKIPDHCHCTISAKPTPTQPSAFSSDCCCNACLVGVQKIRGRSAYAGWYDDVPPTNHGTDYPF